MTQIPIQYSPHQERIFSFIQDSPKSATVIAVAGAGKTTTLVEAFRRINTRALMLAFNKSIADELKTRCPSHVTVATFHSVGFTAWQRYLGNRVTVESSKVMDIMKEEMSPKEGEIYGAFVRKMVSLAKSVGMGYLVKDVESEWAALADHYDCEPESESAKIEDGIAIARGILQLSNAASSRIIDFDDMLFMPTSGLGLSV